METIIRDDAEPDEQVLEALAQHLPYSLPTLRRIQFMNTTGGRKTPTSHVLSVIEAQSPGKEFLVAYLDFSRGPQSEMWLYSSLENASTPSDEAVVMQQILKLLARVREIERTYESQRATPGVILIGSLHKRIFQLLQNHELVKTQSPEHLKFIFKVNDLPSGRQLPDELSWSSVRPSDMPLVLSRTSIPYRALVIQFIKDTKID